MTESANRTFYERPNNQREEVDYITEVNNLLTSNPTSVNPNSELYQRAITQFNENVNRASTTRLAVPEGFCGYIDPESGLFRVQPIPDNVELSKGQIIPNIQTEIDPTIPVEPLYWPIDECLKQGLPGSPNYTQYNTGDGTLVDVTCGSDDDDVIQETGIDWLNMCEPNAGVPEEFTQEYYTELSQQGTTRITKTVTYRDTRLSDSGLLGAAMFGPGTIGTGLIGPVVGNTVGAIIDESTVICTELHRQGLLPTVIYLGDSYYGSLLDKNIFDGYYLWGSIIAKKMKSSKILTNIVKHIVLPCAKEMAYRTNYIQQGSVLGRILLSIGIPICYIIGKLRNYRR